MANGSNVSERRQGRSRRWLLIALILLAVAVLAASMSMRPKKVVVRAEKAERGTISSMISTNGSVEALNAFEAHAPAPTTVRRVLVHEGDQVKAGQLLVQLADYDARTAAAKAEAALRGAEAEMQGIKTNTTANQSQLEKARAELDAAQRNLQAIQALQQKGAASAGEVGVARNRVNAAQADVRVLESKTGDHALAPDTERAQAQAGEARASLTQAEQMLRDANVRAPHDGTVYQLPVHEGQFVNVGDLLVAVADLREVAVHAYVDEPDIGRLTPGQRVDVTWDAVPGRVWQGDVTRLPSTVMLRGTRNVGEIVSRIANPDRKLLPNVNVSVSIITALHENTITVPREAVHSHDPRDNEQGHTGSHIYEIVDGRLRRVEVRTGISNLTRIEVTGGLTPGTLIALSAINNQPLRDGELVRLMQ